MAAAATTAAAAAAAGSNLAGPGPHAPVPAWESGGAREILRPQDRWVLPRRRIRSPRGAVAGLARGLARWRPKRGGHNELSAGRNRSRLDAEGSCRGGGVEGTLV